MQIIAIVALAVLFLDRLSKAIVVNNLAYSQSIPVIPNIFHISLVHNTGAAFGILDNANLLFIIISIASILFILFFIFFRPEQVKSKLTKLALAFILAGATGNLIDRIKFGYVIDFLDFRIWPVFNFADSAITVGIFILIIQLFKKPNASNTL